MKTLLQGLPWLVLCYFVWIEPPYLSYQGLPFEVLNSPRPGQQVQIMSWRCNSSATMRTYPSTRVLERIDAPQDTIKLPPVVVALQPGCHKGPSTLSTIPDGTPAGRYVLHGEAEVAGTIRTSIVPWQTRPFEVMP